MNITNITKLEIEDKYTLHHGALWIPKDMKPPKLRALDLFAGAGGFSLGLTYAGIDVVAAAEWDRAAAMTYLTNLAPTEGCTIVAATEERRIELQGYAGTNEAGDWARDCRWFWNKDVCELTGDIVRLAVGKIDLVVGGPPCQGLSRANRKASVNDPRNKLLGEFVRLVGEIRPQAFMMENVPQLLTIGSGALFNDLEKRLVGFGYTVTSNVVDAANYGVPQRRRRAIIVGTLGDKAYDFPMPSHWARVARPEGMNPWDEAPL